MLTLNFCMFPGVSSVPPTHVLETSRRWMNLKSFLTDCRTVDFRIQTSKSFSVSEIVHTVRVSRKNAHDSGVLGPNEKN